MAQITIDYGSVGGGIDKYYTPKPQVPTLKADSSRVICSGEYNSTFPKWKVFDGKGETRWASSANTVNGAYVGYVFDTAINIRLVFLKLAVNETLTQGLQIKTFKIQGSSDGSSGWTDLKGNDGNTVFSVDGNNYEQWYILNNENSYRGYRIYVLTNYGNTDVSFAELQLFTCKFE